MQLILESQQMSHKMFKWILSTTLQTNWNQPNTDFGFVAEYPSANSLMELLNSLELCDVFQPWVYEAPQTAMHPVPVAASSVNWSCQAAFELIGRCSQNFCNFTKSFLVWGVWAHWAMFELSQVRLGRLWRVLLPGIWGDKYLSSTYFGRIGCRPDPHKPSL